MTFVHFLQSIKKHVLCLVIWTLFFWSTHSNGTVADWTNLKRSDEGRHNNARICNARCGRDAAFPLFPLALLIVPLGCEALHWVYLHIQHPLHLLGLPFVLKCMRLRRIHIEPLPKNNQAGETNEE